MTEGRPTNGRPDFVLGHFLGFDGGGVMLDALGGGAPGGGQIFNITPEAQVLKRRGTDVIAQRRLGSMGRRNSTKSPDFEAPEQVRTGRQNPEGCSVAGPPGTGKTSLPRPWPARHRFLFSLSGSDLWRCSWASGPQWFATSSSGQGKVSSHHFHRRDRRHWPGSRQERQLRFERRTRKHPEPAADEMDGFGTNSGASSS